MGVCIQVFGAIALLVLIVYSCILFTNAIEHLGKSLNLGHSSTGSIFAALGTTLPETIVPLVAIIGGVLTGNLSVGKEIGMGAVLGSPFLLSTITFFFIASAIYIFKTFKFRETIEINADTNSFLRDFKYFFVNYILAVFAGFIHLKILKYIIVIVLLGVYVLYVIRTFMQDTGADNDEELEELKFEKYLKFIITNKRFLIILQILFSIILLIICSHLFVIKIKYFSILLNIQPLILSLIIMPVATELPENVNSILWVKDSKDTLALSNITGALVFQSAIPLSIGILFTPWVFDFTTLFNILNVLLSCTIIFALTKAKNKIQTTIILLGGIFWLAFILKVLGYI